MAQYVPIAPAEHPLSGRVPDGDPALAVEGDDGQRRSMDQRTKRLVGSPQLLVGPRAFGDLALERRVGLRQLGGPLTDPSLQLEVGPVQLLLRPPAVVNALEYHDRPGPSPRLVLDRGGTVIDRQRPPVAPDEQDALHASHFGAGPVNGSAGRLVDEPEYFRDRPAAGLLQRPAGERLRGRIQETDSIVGIRGDHRVGDAPQDDQGPRLIERTRRFMFGHVSGEGSAGA